MLELVTNLTTSVNLVSISVILATVVLGNKCLPEETFVKITLSAFVTVPVVNPTVPVAVELPVAAAIISSFVHPPTVSALIGTLLLVRTSSPV